MCGIAGIHSLQDRPVGRAELAAMIASLEHRGPDDCGIHLDDKAGLAHARLSIIDLACGHQPMSNEDGSIWITFNGEIFNYLELRQDLLQRGHYFRTKSDTEVLIHLYEDYGEELIHELNGQWAFAIWDRRDRKLFLARDRMGVRPLYYTQTRSDFLFASEMKALFTHPEVSPEIDVQGLDQVFTFWHTIAPRTVFRNIRELPPGHSLTVQNGTLRIKRYWQPDFSMESRAPLEAAAEKHLASELLELLLDAARLRLRSDVPVGAYLSGGLDSTLTTALVRKFNRDNLKTFSVAFEDDEFDESPFQQEAVRFLGTDHYSLRCTSRDIADVFPDVIWRSETPLLRTAPAPMFLLSKAVRSQGFKVVITGEGSDEVLGGYDVYKETKVRQFCSVQPDSKWRALLMKRLYPYLPNLQSQSAQLLQAFFHADKNGVNGAFFSHRPRWETTSRIKLFFSDEVRAQLEPERAIEELSVKMPENFESWPAFCRAEYLESSLLLPGYILSSQGDRMAMAHAVEGRYPFLDVRVVEFAAKLPASLKMRVLQEKYLLKECARGLIPESIRVRKKQPYRAPEGMAFFNAGSDYIDDMLSSDRLKQYSIFNSKAVEKLVDKFRSGNAIGIRDNMALIGVLSTQLLLHRFVHQQKHSSATAQR